MRILVIGGTQFIGRHIVSTALAAGDQVTVFHRGRTNPGLFEEAEHRLGDRNTDLSALSTGEWDATIDTSAYVPRQVHSLSQALGGRGGHYVQISSVSAYAGASGPGGNEDLPLAVLDDPTTETVNGHTYGGLKALCEEAAHETFGESVNIVRPTYVAGPYDHTYRFTYWVERLAGGGQILAPGPAANPFQVIDVRDLAAFVVLLSRGGAPGAYHAVSPAPPFSFEGCLRVVAAEVAPAGSELVWVDPDWLEAAGMTGMELPLWAGTDEDRDMSALDPSRAIAAGLRPRPLSETVRELHAHERAEPTPRPDSVGLDAAREKELLASWLATK
ncbi:MAG: NAD-dependent epimerase/dehydratase family protein [Acidimicrobiales bacterium]|jgi:2'-hydroxyisoflavone reductase